MDTPDIINCINKNNIIKNNNKTAISRYSNLTNVEHGTNASTSIATPRIELGHRHPNFTFDFPLCFVHVGKAAGSSVSCSLGLMYANCEGMPRQPPLPRTRYFHMRKNNCLHNSGKDIVTLLVTVRNPLKRIQSWFDFEKNILPTRRNKQDQYRLRRKRGMIFNDCYDNFLDLVTEGLEVSSPGTSDTKDAYKIRNERPVNMTCQERAWAAVLGVREFSYHEWYNYEHYWTALQNDFLGKGGSSRPSMLLLRTEHLSEDWSKISKEDLFKQVNIGNQSPAIALSPSNSSTPSTAISSTMDQSTVFGDRFWSNLCHAMCPEIRIYQKMLEHANNLNTSQVRQSMSEVEALCPRYDPKQNSCPGIPQFPPLRVSRRQYKGETKKRLFVIG